jgi:hypothetical protein
MRTTDLSSRSHNFEFRAKIDQEGVAETRPAPEFRLKALSDLPSD